jgi:hypothetical protein
MDSRRKSDPAEALDSLFQVIREEAMSNPKFARRLLDAVGFTVEFRGEEALASVDPLLVAMHGLEEFRRTFSSMKAKDVSKVGIEFNLIEKEEAKGKKIGALVDLLWDRASERMRDLVPRRQAAE